MTSHLLGKEAFNLGLNSFHGLVHDLHGAGSVAKYFTSDL